MSRESARAIHSPRTGITPSREAEQSALQAERLAAIGKMVTAMAHESRNFLQRIKSAAELLAEIARDASEALEEIVRIQKADEGLEHLLEDLRQFAAPMQLEKMRLKLGTVWRAAWSDVTRLPTGDCPATDELPMVDVVC